MNRLDIRNASEININKRVLMIFVILSVITGASAYAFLVSRPAPFTGQVITDSIRGAIPGQRCVILVTVADDGTGGGEGNPVSISAEALGSIIEIYPLSISPGQIAEVIVIPSESSVNRALNVSIRGYREGLNSVEIVTFGVVGGIDQLGPMAEERRDRFFQYAYPESSMIFQLTCQQEQGLGQLSHCLL